MTDPSGFGLRVHLVKLGCINAWCLDDLLLEPWTYSSQVRLALRIRKLRHESSLHLSQVWDVYRRYYPHQPHHSSRSPPSTLLTAQGTYASTAGGFVGNALSVWHGGITQISNHRFYHKPGLRAESLWSKLPVGLAGSAVPSECGGRCRVCK